MATILWTGYQIEHITARHQVMAEEFEQAWLDRDEPSHRIHPRYGPYFEGFGYTDSGRCLYLVWRWQHQGQRRESDEIWPITAFEWDDSEDAS